jgi:hypothetical protein
MVLQNAIPELFMKISRTKTWLTTKGAVMVGFAAIISTPCFAQSDSPGIQPAVEMQSQLRFSPGIQDVLKMLDAKVDPGVIREFIKNSSIPFNPSAAEIIALKHLNVPDDMITALMQRGAEVRAQMAQMAMAQSAAGMAQTYANTASPGSNYATAPNAYPYEYADYGYGYPYYSYPYYGYPYYGYYGYPYSYWYWYPFGIYWPLYCSFFGSHAFHDHFHHDGFNGHGSVAFHGNSGAINHSGTVNNGAPWRAAGSFAQRPVAGQNGGFRTASGFSGGQMAFAGARTGGFAARPSGFAARPSGFGGQMGGGFAARPNGFGGQMGGGFAARPSGFGGHMGGGFAGRSGGFAGGHGGGGFGGHGGGGGGHR